MALVLSENVIALISALVYLGAEGLYGESACRAAQGNILCNNTAAASASAVRSSIAGLYRRRWEYDSVNGAAVPEAYSYRSVVVVQRLYVR